MAFGNPRVAARGIIAASIYEIRFPVDHVLNIELPWLGILNSGIFRLNRCIFKVGARTKAKYQARDERQPGRCSW